jgi:ATP-binding cassette subfamily C (CFTR/MRP) protein 1
VRILERSQLILDSLSGLATIRAYAETKRFIQENAYYMDLEDRAYLLTTTNQRWLSVRLDFLGGCLVFAIAVMTARGGGGLTPSQIALCLTYMTQIVQIFGMVSPALCASSCDSLSTGDASNG